MFIFEENINFITFPLHVSFQDIDWVQTEKHVFETASNHPFLVGLHSCFQTPSRDHPHITSLLRGEGVHQIFGVPVFTILTVFRKISKI